MLFDCTGTYLNGGIALVNEIGFKIFIGNGSSGKYRMACGCYALVNNGAAAYPNTIAKCNAPRYQVESFLFIIVAAGLQDSPLRYTYIAANGNQSKVVYPNPLAYPGIIANF